MKLLCSSPGIWSVLSSGKYAVGSVGRGTSQVQTFLQTKMRYLSGKGCSGLIVYWVLNRVPLASEITQMFKEMKFLWFCSQKHSSLFDYGEVFIPFFWSKKGMIVLNIIFFSMHNRLLCLFLRLILLFPFPCSFAEDSTWFSPRWQVSRSCR